MKGDAMKSALDVVVGLFEAIFTDLSKLHPSISLELSRDISRLRKASLSSGLPLFTITLPSFSKYLERSLADGCLITPRPHFLSAKSKGDLRPKLFYGLWCMIFETDGTLRHDCDNSAVKSLRQIFLAAKKLRMECEDRYVDKTISEFREIEKSLPQSWDNTWDDDHPIWCRRDGHPIWGAISMDVDQTTLFDDAHTMLQTSDSFNWPGFRNFVARVSAQLGDIHSFEVKPKHGPGAVADKSDHTKYDGLHWTWRLEAVFPYDYYGAPSPEHLEYVRYVEFPSRLLAVPKTQSGPRLIAAEPTCHQWIQGGIQRWLENRVRHTILADCVDFRSQETSRDLALRSSSSDEFATVDLSSASDRLTTRLVEYCFQGNRSLLDALHACRTRCVEVSPKELILLRKFSTQGSACTFPVQTLVYTMLAIWACAETEGRYDWDALVGFAKRVRVFGDDIILPVNAYPVLTSLLGTCLLKVNESKSFAHGKFRESCGMDAYDGVDVTPAYFRQLPGSASTSLESIVECSNNFHLKGMWSTAEFILKTVPYQEIRKILIKTVDSGAFGLVSFCGMKISHLRKRWNTNIQQDEVQCLVPSTKVTRQRGRGHGDLMQYFSEVPPQEIEEGAKRSIQHLIQPSKYTAGDVARVSGRKSLTWVNPFL